MKNHTNFINEKFLGQEPIFKGKIPEKNSGLLAKSLNWYNDMTDEKVSESWLTAYMKQKAYSKADIIKIININSIGDACKRTTAHLARMEMNGTIFSDENADLVSNQIKKTLAFESKKEICAVNVPQNIISIQDRIKNIAGPHLVFLEDEIFSWYHERKKKIVFPLYNYLQNNQLNGPICNHIKVYITKILNEHVEMMDGTDEQLTEAYAYLPIASKKEILKQLKACVQDVERFVGNRKASVPKIARKKKVITTEKQINSLKYQKEFTKLKIKSVHPELLINAQQLWMYNTKYNQLTIFNALDEVGFSIKGTTLLNFNTNTSIKKKVKKPEEIIQKVLNGGKRGLSKIMEELTTKALEINGRINGDCILLKIVK